MYPIVEMQAQKQFQEWYEIYLLLLPGLQLRWVRKDWMMISGPAKRLLQMCPQTPRALLLTDLCSRNAIHIPCHLRLVTVMILFDALRLVSTALTRLLLNQDPILLMLR